MLPRARSPMAWVRLIAGLWLFAAGVVLGLRSGLGVGPWDVLHDGIRKVTPLSFGTRSSLACSWSPWPPWRASGPDPARW
jgi:uncharacterized membrane protein YczE